MKKVSMYITVIALLVMNIATTAHADCMQGTFHSDVEVSASMSDADHQHGDEQNASCDCCATCSGHHHNHAAFSGSKSEPVMVSSQTVHYSEGATYLSQLHYPPSKPPQSIS